MSYWNTSHCLTFRILQPGINVPCPRKREQVQNSDHEFIKFIMRDAFHIKINDYTKPPLKCVTKYCLLYYDWLICNPIVRWLLLEFDVTEGCWQRSGGTGPYMYQRVKTIDSLDEIYCPRNQRVLPSDKAINIKTEYHQVGWKGNPLPRWGSWLVSWFSSPVRHTSYHWTVSDEHSWLMVNVCRVMSSKRKSISWMRHNYQL